MEGGVKKKRPQTHRAQEWEQQTRELPASNPLQSSHAESPLHEQ